MTRYRRGMGVTPERWRRIEELFAHAVELRAAERASFVGDACGDDADLRAELDSLLAASDGAATSLERAIASSAASLTSLAGGRFGPYRVERLIGEGGMGTVYLAERDDAEYRRRVASRSSRGLLAPAVARFRDERQILAWLDHPGHRPPPRRRPHRRRHPVPGDGARRGRADRPHAPTAASTTGCACCSGMRRRCGTPTSSLIVHRDSSRATSWSRRDGEPKLLDFGIAKLLDPLRPPGPAPAPPRSPRTTPAPSRSAASRYVATDVYSLGSVLYDSWSAGRRRAGATMLETSTTSASAEPARPSTAAPVELRREIAGDLDNILLRALAKRPERRYPSMAAFADDLSRYLSGRPVAAREATFAYRAGSCSGAIAAPSRSP